ncbi:hypothetical protein MGN70_008150 [Eutypa lata]|nr:hypothetical protein MGN70_008150 [Eutypa lata]
MSSSSLNRYWIPQMDINRKVITQELQYYLGPDATVRPYTREGEDGFLITTAGSCLTDEQIDDICLKSREMWEKQAAARSQQLSPDKPLKPNPLPRGIREGIAEGMALGDHMTIDGALMLAGNEAHHNPKRGNICHHAGVPKRRESRASLQWWSPSAKTSRRWCLRVLQSSAAEHRM